MTPADGTYFAHYEKGSSKPLPDAQIVAWNDNGDAMILGKNGLIAAHELPGFERVRRHHNSSKVVAALPGAGWMVDTTYEDGETLTAPVLAWLVHQDGDVVPVDADTEGSTGPAVGEDGFKKVKVYHPDHEASR